MNRFIKVTQISRIKDTHQSEDVDFFEEIIVNTRNIVTIEGGTADNTVELILCVSEDNEWRSPITIKGTVDDIWQMVNGSGEPVGKPRSMSEDVLNNYASRTYIQKNGIKK